MSSKLIITLDSSQMKTFMECEQKWCMSYVENLQYHLAKMIYLDKGTFVHKLLEVFYVLRTLNPKEDRFITQKTVIDLYKKGKLFKHSGLTKEDEQFICERFLQYVMKWISYDFVPSKRNGTPGVEIGFSKVLYETEESLYIVEGKIDLISQTNHPIPFDCFVDNKSQERMKNLYPFKPQFLTYAWATGFKWGIINYFRLQQKYDPRDTFRRDLIYFEDWQVNKWKVKMIRLFERIERVMRKNEISQMENLKPEMFEQNELSCGGANESSPCSFTHICENPGYEKEMKMVYYNVRSKWSPWTEENGVEL